MYLVLALFQVQFMLLTIKINFGDDDDLQIYHSPSAGSIIQDIGPGNLSIFGSNEVIIGNQNGAETKANSTWRKQNSIMIMSRKLKPLLMVLM